MVFIRLYREGKLERDDVSAHEIEALARQEDAVLWIDFTDPTADELLGVETVYGLHRLAVEDAVHDFQRPKLDRYPNHCSSPPTRQDSSPAPGNSPPPKSPPSSPATPW